MKTVGPSHPTAPEDAVAAKTALARLGHDEIPEFGITPYPDSALFDSLRNFQKEQELEVDGLMKPGGPTSERLGRLLAERPKEGGETPALRHNMNTNTTSNAPAMKPNPEEPEIPILNMEKDRLQSIVDDTPARFQVSPNPNADGDDVWYDIPQKGGKAVKDYAPLIEEMAEKYDVDPDLVRAVMWAENTRGHKWFLNELADDIRWSDSALPMNMNKETGAKLLGLQPSDLYDARNNVEAATIFLKRLHDHIEAPNPTPAQVGSIWYFTGQEKLNDFGKFIQRIYDEKPWQDKSNAEAKKN